jgi:hypothetical protein
MLINKKNARFSEKCSSMGASMGVDGDLFTTYEGLQREHVE